MEQSKLVQGDWEACLGIGEILDTDFKGEPANFCRKNKAPASLGVQLKISVIQCWKYTPFYIIYLVTDGKT